MPSKPAKKTTSKATVSAAPSAGPAAEFKPSVVPLFGPVKVTASTPSFFNNAFESVEKTMNMSKNQYEKITSEASAAGRQGFEAMVKSMTTFAKGAEQIGKTVASIVQESTERNSDAFKVLMASKTISEYSEAQNKLAQQSFEDAISTATKLSEMTIKLCTEAFEPLNDQMTKAAKKATDKFAA